jgi:hypothetical protein
LRCRSRLLKGLYELANIFASLYDAIEPRARAHAAGSDEHRRAGEVGALGRCSIVTSPSTAAAPKIENMSKAIASTCVIYVFGAALLLGKWPLVSPFHRDSNRKGSCMIDPTAMGASGGAWAACAIAIGRHPAISIRNRKRSHRPRRASGSIFTPRSSPRAPSFHNRL